MEKIREEMRNVASTLTIGQSGARKQSDNQRGLNNMQLSRVTKIEFPRFKGEDVRGWLFKCEQFFKVVGVLEDQKPRSLAELYGLAKLQEANMNAMKSKNKMPLLPNSRFNGYNSTYLNSLEPVSLPTLNSNWRNRTANPNTAPIRKQLTQKELEEKRAKNLCFYGDKKYAHGHKCPSQMFSLEVVVDNDKEDIEEDSVSHISLNSLIGRNTFQTMRVIGYVGKHEIHILIDSSSSHNFLDSKTAKKLGYQLKSTCPLQVYVANGGCEMVLGIQWLSTFGNITCNFRDLKMSFQYNGRMINLRGSQKGAVQWLQVLNMVSAKKNDAPKGLQILIEDYNDVFVKVSNNTSIWKYNTYQ
ncbi:hypothetical protein Tco_0679698 [Tanacetum coccineum]|uniref:Uncharacterized protein n=1 Tax=Tanacetum coccineum TaxID=301880 RepID=A0ABQ4XIK1_9ASTR